MSIDLYWDNDEQTVLLCEFNGRWTWEELQTVLATVKRMSEERRQVFGAIVDVRNGLTLPGGSIFNREALTNFQKMLHMGQGGKGPVVILGMSGMIKTVFDAVKSVDKNAARDVHFAGTMPEAQRTIYSIMQRMNEATA
ncbi:MAG: hypothetical protein MUE40_18075 [Anaerolineae bacterium]|jgi:hypothetical protein|nr:hypothetical protein [Anaerolineae bacterium]